MTIRWNKEEQIVELTVGRFTMGMGWDKQKKRTVGYMTRTLNKRQIDARIEKHLNILLREPDNVSTHFGLGNLYASKGMMREARREWEQVFALDRDGVFAQALREQLKRFPLPHDQSL